MATLKPVSSMLIGRIGCTDCTASKRVADKRESVPRDVLLKLKEALLKESD